MNRQSTGADQPKKPNPVGQKGYTGNPGGRPKALREIEQMLTREHRNPANMKLVFDTLRMFALRGEKGDAAYAKLYLERVLGPVKDLDDLDELMRDAPPEVIEFLKKVVH